MTAQSSAALYTPHLLGLATSLADYPFNDDAPYVGHARSSSCGSTLALSFSLDDAGHVAAPGAKVTACAIGQASVALFLRSCKGKSVDELHRTAEKMEAWITSEGPLPDLSGLDALIPAREYPARHGAILLPWRAFSAALPKSGAQS